MSNKSNVQNIYELSPMQEGMLFHAVMDEQSTAYVEQTVMTLRGTLDPDLFEKALQELVGRYDILRTVFVYKTTKRPRQVVLNEQKADFYFEDLSHKLEGSGTAYLKDFSREDREKGFDLTKGPLLRVSLFKVTTQTWCLVWTFHHILMDGWCLGILFKDFIHLYYAGQSGKLLTTEPVLPYSRYIQWLEKQDRQKGLDYWTSFLEGCEAPAGLPKLRRSPDNARYQGGEYWFTMEEFLTQDLQQIARNNRVTENTLFQTLWGILLQKCNDTLDVVFGVVVSGRPAEIPGIEKMVGLFINTVPARIKTEPGEVFSHLLKKVQLHTLQSKPYEFLPLADIQAFGSLQNQPLDHIVVFENYPGDKSVQDAGRGSSGFMVEYAEMYEQTNYDLNVVFAPARQMGIKFIFNRTVYDEEFIKQVTGQLKEMARQVVNNPEIKVSEIDTITGEERQRLLIDLNDTQTGYPKDKTLHQLFEEQAEKVPERAAVVGNRQLAVGKKEKMHIIYRVLNEKANQVAEVLREKGVLADDIVGIMVGRSIEMIVGILGILKAGCAYLPIEPEYPQERIDFMLKDSGARILLTNLSEGRHFHHSSNQFIDHHSGSLAYVIYTSGTTGKPRGVMTTHYNAVRVVKCTNYIEISPQDRVMQISNYAFDGSIFDIFGALLNGAVLVMMEGEGISALDRLSEQIKREQITVFFVTTALFNALVDMDTGCLKDIRRVLYGGERISVPHARRALDYLGPGRIIHVYGPTETTVYATYYPIDAIDEIRVTIPIGRSLSNTTVYILNKELNVVPVGAVGELYIGGEGVARGYLNRPELTAERFLFSSYRSYRTYISKKLYKTGDLVRMLSDGNIEFIGRVDRQVKIRGFRVEPGEIEYRLLKHEKIKEVFVTAGSSEDGSGSSDKYLCAYIVPIIPGDLDHVEIREYLAVELPDYMIPAYFVMMEKLPLTPNGKVDGGALPKPKTEIPGKKMTVPSNLIEERIAHIWSEILSVPAGSISIDADFFDLGGHSLRAMTMLSRLHKEVGIKIPLREVFASPTIGELAAYVESKKVSGEAGKNIYRAIELAEEQEYYPVSSAQKRLYVFQQMVLDSTAYNIPSIMELTGELDKNKLEKVFTQLIERHESLRTSFQIVKGEPVQKVHRAPGIGFKLEYYDLQGIEPTGIVKNFIRPFDLARAPLVRLGLMPLDTPDFVQDKYLLMVDIHHIITDGVSMELFFKEFLALYSGKTLPYLKLQFKDYSQWHNRNSVRGGEAYRKQEAFWLKQLEKVPAPLNLPTDFERPVVQSFEGDRVEFEIDGETTKKLREIVSAVEGTLFMLLQAICRIWLSKLSGQEDFVLGIPIEGRNHSDLQHIIGMFINTLAVRARAWHSKTLREFLHEVKEQTLEAFENQEYQFEDLVKALSLTPEPGRNPVFDVMFVLQNMEADAAYMADVFEEPAPEKSHVNMKAYPFKNPAAKFDILLTAWESRDDDPDHVKPVYMILEYSTRLFKQETIERFVKYFNDIVRAVIDDKNIRLGDIVVSHGLKQVESYNPEMDLGF
jgi:amino acid adenylation domain-containing protein